MGEGAGCTAAEGAEVLLFAGGAVVVVRQDRLVAGGVDGVSAAVRELIPERKRIVLDLRKVWYVDSTGLGTLVRLLAAAKSGGSRLELMHLSRPVKEVLVLTHLWEVFPVLEDDTEFRGRGWGSAAQG